MALYGPDGEVPGVVRDSTVRMEIERIGREAGWQVATKSGFLDGFGHAILRSGQGDRQRALWMRYGKTVQHAHNDILTYGLEAFKRRMLPELGYPQGWTYAGVWEKSWATHYGTHIVGLRTRSFQRGRLTLFADSAPARVAVAETHARDQLGRDVWRQRTIVLVDRPDGGCYAVTLERVKGGAAHHHSFHGPDGTAKPIGLDLTPQDGGTLLGPDSDYGDDSSVRGIDRELASYAFMYDVSRGSPREVWGMDFALRDQEGVGLRTTVVYPADARLAVAKGRPPGGGSNPYEMTWCVLQRSGTPPLASQFLTVLEPHQSDPAIQRVERVITMQDQPAGAFPARALRVSGEGFTDLLVFQTDSDSECRTEAGLTAQGEFSFIRFGPGGEPGASVLANGRRLAWADSTLLAADAPYRGRVVACDWNARTVTIEPLPAEWEGLAGAHIQLHNDFGSHTSYTVNAVKAVGGACELTLDLDPRIGEGFVKSLSDAKVESHVRLRMARLRGYYDGKTIANEDGSEAYPLAYVERGQLCAIDRGDLQDTQLRREFSDLDGDGLTRFVIYDYGPGDSVTINTWDSRTR
jgi:hypothetical protein